MVNQNIPATAGSGEENRSFFDFLTDSLISEAVLDTMRDQGIFARIGANVLGELTSPLGIASTALLATGVGAPLGAGLRAATAGTRLARAGSLAAGALEPVTMSARGLTASQIVRNPAILSRSLAGEAGVTAGLIAAGGLLKYAGQQIPGPTRSAPGQLVLGVAGGVLGGGLSARTFNNILDTPTRINVAEVAAKGANTPQGQFAAKVRPLIERVSESEKELMERRGIVTTERTARGFAAMEGKEGAGAQSRAFRSQQTGELPGRRMFKPLTDYDRWAGVEEGGKPRDLPDLTDLRINELGAEGGITVDDIKTVDEAIQTVYRTRPYDMANTTTAFVKFMTGELPTPSEFELLRPVLGDQLIEETQRLVKSRGQRAFDQFEALAGLPRSLMSSFDISAVFRQGLIGSVAHPKAVFFTGGKDAPFIRMFRAMVSEDNARMFEQQHKMDPELQRFIQGTTKPKIETQMQERNYKNGLFLHSLDSTDISRREEVWGSNFAEKIPGIGRVIKASERAYGTFLNESKIAITKNRFNTLKQQGVPISDTAIAQHNQAINYMFGRGTLGPLERMETTKRLLSVAFWSPRLLTSRFQTLTAGGKAIKNLRAEDPAVRAISKEIALDLAKATAGITTAVTALSFLPGVSVNLDPRSSDFGKVRQGNTRYDPWAGFQQVIRYTSQFTTGKRTSISGKVSDVERDEVLGRFLRSKLAPGFSTIAASDLPEDLVISGLTGGGKDFIGDPIRDKQVKPGDAAFLLTGGQATEIPAELDILIDQMVPLLIQDIIEAMRAEGIYAAAGPSLSNALGIGSQTYGSDSQPRPGITGDGSSARAADPAEQEAARRRAALNAAFQ